MPDFIRKHPALLVSVMLLVFLLWSLPIWLATVWPMVTTKSFPEWIAGKGLVLGMSQFIYFFLTLGLTVMVIAAYVVTLEEIKKYGPAWSFEPFSISSTAQIANIDFSALKNTEPFITFRVDLRNNSGRDVTIAGLEGFISCDGERFTSIPSLNVKPLLQNANGAALFITQPLSQVMAGKIANALKGEGAIVSFDTSNLVLKVEIRSPKKQSSFPIFMWCKVKGPILLEDNPGQIGRIEPMFANQSRYELFSGNRRKESI